MKTIQELIDEKTTNLNKLIESRNQLIKQHEQITLTIIELNGHIAGLKAASQATKDSEQNQTIETNDG